MSRWTQASRPFGSSVAITPSHGPRRAATLSTRALPKSVLVAAHATTLPFGRERSGTVPRTTAIVCATGRGSCRGGAIAGRAASAANASSTSASAYSSTSRELRWAPTLRFTRWRALSTVLVSHSSRSAIAS